MIFTNLCFVLFLVLGFLPVTGDVHSLFYLYTMQSKNSDCTAVTLLNDRQIDFYNSADKSRTAKQNWLKIIPQSDWKTITEKLQYDRQLLNILLNTQMSEFGHSNSGVHVLQWRHGCEGEQSSDGSLTVLNSINEFGYDGEDLIQFNCTSKTWITPEKKKNREMEEKWSKIYDAVKRCLQCEEILKIFLKYKTTNNTPSHAPPAVHIFAKKSVRDWSKLILTCLITGFYPKDVKMSLRKFSTSFPEHLLISSGVRPNDDETYQLRKSVEISYDDPADYDCYVNHSSLKKPLIKKWVNPNNSPGTALTGGAVVGGVIFLILLAVLIIVFQWRRRMNGGAGRRQFLYVNPQEFNSQAVKVPGVLPLQISGTEVAPEDGESLDVILLPSYQDLSTDERHPGSSRPPSYKEPYTGVGGPGLSRPPSYKDIYTGGRRDGVSRPPSYELCAHMSTDDEDVTEAVNYDPAASQPEDSSS